MPRPTDASPSPFVGYYSPDEPTVETPTDAPGSQNSQVPFVHPQDLASPFATDEYDISQERGIAVARLAEHAVRQSQLASPHFNILHDRMRTTQAWEHQIDALFEGSLAAPAAGGSVLANIIALNPLLPGDPGKRVYPCISFVSVGAQGTTLTGLWSVDALFNNQTIPLGVYSGLASGSIRSELISSTPFSGSIDDQAPIGQLRISVLAGATVAAVTFYAQVCVAFVYDYVRPLSDIRELGSVGSVGSERGVHKHD